VGDFNTDYSVNSIDLLLLLGDFGCSANCLTDLNGDGLSGTGDLLLFLAAFGNC
jgi:hypothetical protein